MYLIVAVDLFSKWTEAQAIESKHAFRTATWFYNSICARFGKPSFIRTDNGTEWGGEFSILIKRLGIVHRHITVGNSKGNGMVERTIRSVKDTIRKFQAQFTDSYWSDSIPYALIALNHTP